MKGLERRLRLVKSVMVNHTTVLQATATSMTAAGPFPAEADNPRDISGWESALGISEQIRFCLYPGGPHSRPKNSQLPECVSGQVFDIAAVFSHRGPTYTSRALARRAQPESRG